MSLSNFKKSGVKKSVQPFALEIALIIVVSNCKNFSNRDVVWQFYILAVN